MFSPRFCSSKTQCSSSANRFIMGSEPITMATLLRFFDTPRPLMWSHYKMWTCGFPEWSSNGVQMEFTPWSLSGLHPISAKLRFCHLLEVLEAHRWISRATGRWPACRCDRSVDISGMRRLLTLNLKTMSRSVCAETNILTFFHTNLLVFNSCIPCHPCLLSHIHVEHTGASKFSPHLDALT